MGDGNDRPRLESRARSLGLSHAVSFAGRVGDDELAALYDRCRFFVMPSRDEGFGLVFLEAMRAGKACIGARGAAAEIIEHDVTGLIVDPDRHEDLAAAVFRLFDEPATCAGSAPPAASGSCRPSPMRAFARGSPLRSNTARRRGNAR